MRVGILLASVSMIAACSAGSDNKTPSPSPDVYQLIMADDPMACAAEDAIETAISAASDEYTKMITAGAEKIKVDTVSATNIDKSIHQISCRATAHYQTFLNGIQSRLIEYKLRPALDEEGNYVAEIADAESVASIVQAHALWWQESQNPTDNGAEESAQETQNGSLTTAAGGNQEKTCNARVLHDVSPVGNPDYVMKKGTIWQDVTQFWRTKATGETKFCAHGDSCYPAQIVVDGQTTDAFKLLNCSVAAEGEDDGEEILYSTG